MREIRLSTPHGAEVEVPAAVRRVKSFYVPRSHPDGYSVNARCLDAGTVEQMTIVPLDGRNWEQSYPKGRGEYDSA